MKLKPVVILSEYNEVARVPSIHRKPWTRLKLQQWRIRPLKQGFHSRPPGQNAEKNYPYCYHHKSLLLALATGSLTARSSYLHYY